MKGEVLPKAMALFKKRVITKFKKLRQFRFKYDENIISDRGTSQRHIIIQVLRKLPMPTDSRTVSAAIAAHPDFKTRISYETAGRIKPVERVWNYWMAEFKKLGLIEMVEEENDRETD